MTFCKRLTGLVLAVALLWAPGLVRSAAVSARANGPILKPDYRLADLGFGSTVLQGVESSVEFFFFGPQGVPLRPAGSYLDLVLAYSPLLLADSTVSVELNSVPAASEYLTSAQAQRRAIRIPLPDEEIREDINGLRIRLFMRLSDDACADGRNPALAATILSDTTLHYEYAESRPEVPPRHVDIADFPAPILYSFDPKPPVINLVVPDSPSGTDISVALSLAGELAKTYQPFSKPVIRVLRVREVTEGARQSGSFVLIGRPEQNSLLIAALVNGVRWDGSRLSVGEVELEADSGVLAVAPEPWGSGQLALLVTGNSEAGLAEAGRILVTPSARSTVRQPVSVVKGRRSASASPTRRTDRLEVSLRDLGVGSRAFTGSGTHVVAFSVVAPPASPIDPSELILDMSHSPLLSADSIVTVEVNGTRVDSLRLDSVGFANAARRIVLPPAVLAAGSNSVRVVIEAFFGQPAECGGPPEVGGWVELHERTRLVVRARGGMSAPSLSDFPYPFVLGLDIAAMRVVFSPDDDLTALGRLGAAVGAWLNSESRWIPAVPESEVDRSSTSGQSYLVFGTATWNHLLAELMPDEPLRWSPADGRLLDSPGRMMVGLPDNAKVGVLQVIQSPWDPHARILTVSSTSAEMLPKAVEALIDPDFPGGVNLQTVSVDGRKGMFAVEMPFVEVQDVDILGILIDNLPVEIAAVLLLAVAASGAFIFVRNIRGGV